MKRTYRRVLNIFSISLLLVALYLNFIKKEPADNAEITTATLSTNVSNLNSIKSSPEKQPEASTVLK